MTRHSLPTPPDGWELVAPADAVAGDAILFSDGRMEVLDERRFDAYEVDVRRSSWVIRQRK